MSKEEENLRKSPEPSRFNVDGVVAEMVIEVDDHESPTKSTFVEKKETDAKMPQTSKSTQSLDVKDSLKVVSSTLNIEDEQQKVDIDVSDASLDEIVPVKNKKSKVLKDQPKTKKKVPEVKSSNSIISTRGMKRKMSTEATGDKNVTDKSKGKRNRLSNRENIDNVSEPTESKNNNTRKSTPRQKAKAESPVPEVKTKKNIKIEGLSLSSIPGLCDRIKEARKNALKPLYRAIYFQPPSLVKSDKIVPEILQFNGFSFEKDSFQYVKRKQLLNGLVDSDIRTIGQILGTKTGPKSASVENILKFLLKPNFKVCETDKALQPIVKIEKLSLADKYLSKSLKLDTPKAKEVSKTPPVLRKKIKSVPSKTPKSKETPKRTTKPGALSKTSAAMRRQREEILMIKKEIQSEAEDSQSSLRKSTSALHSSSTNKFSDPGEDEPVGEISPVIKTEQLDEANEKVSNKEDSSEETLSSEETAEERKKAASPAKKNPVKKFLYLGTALEKFPNIRTSVYNADIQPLQRLHILLFGASVKPEQLRQNILAFGGFPFMENSEEWKQKKFLLSLLALNTLREYLKILCIDFQDEDQSALIDKLMKFLAAPGADDKHAERKVARREIKQVMKTKVVSKELVKKKPVKKKLKPNQPDKPKGPRHRKVLMDEAQVRRLEADIAREQRILAREKKLLEEQTKRIFGSQTGGTNIANRGGNSVPFKNETKVMQIQAPVKTASSTNLINTSNLIARKIPATKPDAKLGHVDALLQTVYKRRALKEAGVIVSIPNTATRTKLGEMENVKFMVVTANYNDLDILHHLIFMEDAAKSKVRRNILEFEGFGFDEDSEKYKKRMDFLKSLGYDISKRIAFLLGLSSFRTDIAQQDLNELIMYFLMSPSKIKHAPIKDMPQDFFRDANKEMTVLMMKPSDPAGPKIFLQDLTSIAQGHLKPNKSTSSPKKQTKKVPSDDSEADNDIEFVLSTNSDSNTVVNVKAKQGSTPVACNKVVVPKQMAGLPLQSQSPRFILQPQQPTQTVQITNTLKSPATLLPHKQFILQDPILPPASTNTPPQFIVQQQTTPGGPSKMFKLVKLPTNHPLASALGNKTLHVNTQQSNVLMKMGPPILRMPQQSPVFRNSVSGNILPPGIILFKKDSQGNLIPTNQTVQASAAQQITPKQSITSGVGEEYVLPNEMESSEAADCWSNDDVVEVLHPLESNPPTDDELFASIQEIIHNSNFEDITLRNVIDKVSAQYSDSDLTHRHNFMKDCVKRIIIGT